MTDPLEMPEVTDTLVDLAACALETGDRGTWPVDVADVGDYESSYYAHAALTAAWPAAGRAWLEWAADHLDELADVARDMNDFATEAERRAVARHLRGIAAGLTRVTQ